MLNVNLMFKWAVTDYHVMQVLSTVLLNIIPEDKPALNLTGRAKIPAKVCLSLTAWCIVFSKLICDVLDPGLDYRFFYVYHIFDKYIMITLLHDL